MKEIDINQLKGDRNLRRKYQILKHLDETKAFERFCERVGAEVPEAETGKAFGMRSVWTSLAVAAVLIVLAVLSVKLFVNPETTDSQVVVNIAPGKEQAFLTTASGKQVSLDESSSIVEEGMVASVVDGELIVEDGDDTSMMNMISIPRGGEYRVTLPDGTRVHLNAESTLEFPSRFSREVRIVRLTGEAYFDVAKDSKSPFIVEVGTVSVKQYGTHYNINAYNANHIEVTLVEGSIGVSADGSEETKLTSGYQAVVTVNGIKVQKVDIHNVTGWNEGVFSFEGMTLEQIAVTLSRWYDTDFEVEEGLRRMHFSGSLMRDENLGDILDAICEITNTRYEYNHHTIKVTKK